MGDLICGETGDYGDDFRFLPASRPRRPQGSCVALRRQSRKPSGRRCSRTQRRLRRLYGPGWHNYLYTVGGIAFVVVDTSGAHRPADEVTAARAAFVTRAFERAANMPVILLSHVPLVAMRKEEILRSSFGFSSWKIVEPSLLDMVTGHADRVIAVLCGHIHISGIRVVHGVHHVMPSGTAGYPMDFASFDVYPDHIDVTMHRAPAALLGDRSAGNIHGARRHGVDYVDDEHTDHESYLSGNPAERRCTIPLDGARRPDVAT